MIIASKIERDKEVYKRLIHFACGVSNIPGAGGLFHPNQMGIQLGQLVIEMTDKQMGVEELRYMYINSLKIRKRITTEELKYQLNQEDIYIKTIVSFMHNSSYYENKTGSKVLNAIANLGSHKEPSKGCSYVQLLSFSDETW